MGATACCLLGSTASGQAPPATDTPPVTSPAAATAPPAQPTDEPAPAVAPSEPSPDAAATSQAQGAQGVAVEASATPVPTEAEAAAAEPAAATPDAPEPSWTDYVKIGGGAILWYYQPLIKGADNNLQFFNVRLSVDAAVGDFGFHAEPRFRDTRLRGFFEGTAWLQEAYGSWSAGPEAIIKVGKSYSQLGLFWDNSFYGNVQVYDGLKLAPDYGVSLEGKIGDRFGLSYWAQFFLVDGRTNVALADRDTLAYGGARRRNEIVAKLEPYYAFSESSALKVGVSVQHFEADLAASEENVLRLAAHAKLTVDGFGIWAEGLVQDGAHVSDFPYAGVPATDTEPAVPGRASGKNQYLLAGVEYTLDRFTARYNVSFGNYDDVDVSELLHVPSLTFQINALLALSAELVLWHRDTPEGDVDVDESLNVLLYANF